MDSFSLGKPTYACDRPHMACKSISLKQRSNSRALKLWLIASHVLMCQVKAILCHGFLECLPKCQRIADITNGQWYCKKVSNTTWYSRLPCFFQTPTPLIIVLENSQQLTRLTMCFTLMPVNNSQFAEWPCTPHCEMPVYTPSKDVSCLLYRQSTSHQAVARQANELHEGLNHKLSVFQRKKIYSSETWSTDFSSHVNHINPTSTISEAILWIRK